MKNITLTLTLTLLSLWSLGQTISSLPAASTLGGTEVVPGVQGGTTKKISINQIGTFIGITYAPIASPTFTGTVTTPLIKITGGSPGSGKVLTADADGDATWETPSSGGATAAGATGNVQYKSNGGGLQAEAAYTYDSATNILTVGNISLPNGAVFNFSTGDITVTHSSNLLTLAGGEFVVPAEAYASGWNGDNSVPTKNDVYDKIETMSSTTNTSSSLTDGGTVTITGVKHTLTSTQATITWTLSQTPDFQTTDIILNATSTTWTFPANTLVVVDGIASGNNIAAITGVSGDHHMLSIYKDGTNYRVVIKNFGQ